MFCLRFTMTHLKVDVFNLLRLSTMAHMTVSEDGKVQTNKCLSKPGPVCDLTVCQKSIYLAEQGGRSRPGLKNWVSGRLSPSALSQLGMRVLHHPTRSVTSAGHTGRGWWGVRAMGCRALHKHLPCGATRPALVSPHASTAHEHRGSTFVAAPDQGHYNSPKYTTKSFVFCAL